MFVFSSSGMYSGFKHTVVQIIPVAQTLVVHGTSNIEVMWNAKTGKMYTLNAKQITCFLD